LPRAGQPQHTNQKSLLPYGGPTTVPGSRRENAVRKLAAERVKIEVQQHWRANYQIGQHLSGVGGERKRPLACK